MLRSLIALSVLASVPAPGLALTIPSPYGASFGTVPQLICSGKNKAGKVSIWLGSGVRLSDSLVVTASHVTSGGTCRAQGEILSTLRNEPDHDVTFSSALLGDGFRAIVSCEGIHEGQRYLAMGYADGGAPDVEVLIGTDAMDGDQAVMHGHVYPGMSGGAVLNGEGALVAIINQVDAHGHPLSYVTPLSETYLCKGERG